MRCVLVAVLVVAGYAGCVDQGPGPQPKVEPGYEREHLLKAAPPDLERFDVTLGDAVIYLGNKVDRPRLAPGQPVTITHYWQVVKPPGKQWRPFALVRGPAGSADFMNLPPTDMQRVHPVAEWQAGEIIEDIQKLTIRPDWRSPSATVLVGLIEVGRHGTLDRMAAVGARTADRAIVAAQLEIDLTRAPPPPGTIHIPRAQAEIKIDGIATDPGWANAVASGDFVTAEGSPEPVGKAIGKLVWDDQYLYLHVAVTDTDVYSPYKQQDEPLWKADCIEIFIDADGNRRGYIELQVNPNNATFDSWFAGPRGPAGDEAWDSEMLTAVQVRGTPDRAGDADQGWDVELAIPWAAVRGKDAQMAIRTPPPVGERWKLNVVRVDKRSGSENPSASSWNRITYRDFHALDRMLTAIFADTTGAIVPSAAPAEPSTGTGSGSAAPGSGSGSGSGSAMPGPPMQGSATQLTPMLPSTGSATSTPATPKPSATSPTTIPPGTGSAAGSAAPVTPDPRTVPRAPKGPETKLRRDGTGGGAGGGTGSGPASPPTTGGSAAPR